mmetsp:Transcript_18371/g.27723  ORF Transcript_18371/g.27723 Transcript_18371/m.27723 type:complete len:200 (+) Transcript_18371:163-762(+)
MVRERRRSCTSSNSVGPSQLSLPSVSTLRLSNATMCLSQSGTSVARISFGASGGTTMRARMASFLSSTATTATVLGMPARSWSVYFRPLNWNEPPYLCSQTNRISPTRWAPRRSPKSWVWETSGTDAGTSSRPARPLGKGSWRASSGSPRTSLKGKRSRKFREMFSPKLPKIVRTRSGIISCRREGWVGLGGQLQLWDL